MEAEVQKELYISTDISTRLKEKMKNKLLCIETLTSERVILKWIKVTDYELFPYSCRFLFLTSFLGLSTFFGGVEERQVGVQRGGSIVDLCEQHAGCIRPSCQS